MIGNTFLNGSEMMKVLIHSLRGVGPQNTPLGEKAGGQQLVVMVLMAAILCGCPASL